MHGRTRMTVNPHIPRTPGVGGGGGDIGFVDRRKLFPCKPQHYTHTEHAHTGEGSKLELSIPDLSVTSWHITWIAE